MAEYVAAAALERNGLKCYLPRVETPNPRPGHNDTPLFPGYIFVQQEPKSLGLPEIHNMAGFVGWVQFDNSLPNIPHEIILELINRIESINNQGGYWKRYKPGERVRISTAKLDSIGEVLEEPISPEARVKVLLRFMGRFVQTQVPWQDLQPIQDDWSSSEHRRPTDIARTTRGRGRWIRGFGPREQEVSRPR